MSSLLFDIRYGIRMMARTPGFSILVVLILALGIGANSAVFSIVNAVVLRPLPFQNPGGLFEISEMIRRVSLPGSRIST